MRSGASGSAADAYGWSTRAVGAVDLSGSAWVTSDAADDAVDSVGPGGAGAVGTIELGVCVLVNSDVAYSAGPGAYGLNANAAGFLRLGLQAGAAFGVSSDVACGLGTRGLGASATIFVDPGVVADLGICVQVGAAVSVDFDVGFRDFAGAELLLQAVASVLLMSLQLLLSEAEAEGLGRCLQLRLCCWRSLRRLLCILLSEAEAERSGSCCRDDLGAAVGRRSEICYGKLGFSLLYTVRAIYW